MVLGQSLNKVMAVKNIEYVKQLIKATPDFPIKGILFQDIFPIFQDYEAVQILCDELISRMPDRVDAIVGLDARGFLLGPMLAQRLQCSFVPIRKKGKLPGDVQQVAYEKEYGTDYFEIQSDAIPEGAKVVVFDDLLATGGSAYAASQLVQKLKAEVVLNLFIIELTGLKGSQKLGPVSSIFQYEF